MLTLMALTDPAALAAGLGEAARLAILIATGAGVATAAVAVAIHREAERQGRMR